MDHPRRRAAASLGVLLLSAAFAGAGAARAQNDRLLGSRPAVEPEADEPGPGSTEGTDAARTPESVIRDWPEDARVTARAMIEKYGEPERFTDAALVWIDNGPWRKTVVYRHAQPHFLWNRDKDYLEQTISYRVPVDKIEDLKRFDSRLEVDAGRGLLSSRSESEAMNFLALNLADEVASGVRGVRDAREFYEKTERLAQAGKSSPYLRGLLFSTSSAPARTR